MQYTEKTGIITRIGPKKSSFPNGTPITIKFKDQSYPGVSVGVQFDFDKDVWYSGILSEKQAEALSEGKSINVKVWEKESNGRVFKNFGLVSAKASAEKAIADINPLKQEVQRHGQQIMSMYAELQKIKDWISKKETTTMFDDNAKDVHPEEYREIYGDDSNSNYDDPSEIPF